MSFSDWLDSHPRQPVVRDERSRRAGNWSHRVSKKNCCCHFHPNTNDVKVLHKCGMGHSAGSRWAPCQSLPMLPRTLPRLLYCLLFVWRAINSGKFKLKFKIYEHSCFWDVKVYLNWKLEIYVLGGQVGLGQERPKLIWFVKIELEVSLWCTFKW